MAKLIKVTNHYWDEHAEASYSPFSYRQISNVIEDYTEEDASADEYKNLVDGVVGSWVYTEPDYRSWDEPSGYTIKIVDVAEEIKYLTANLNENIKKIEETASKSAE